MLFQSGSVVHHRRAQRITSVQAWNTLLVAQRLQIDPRQKIRHSTNGDMRMRSIHPLLRGLTPHRRPLRAIVSGLAIGCAAAAWAHGDVTPQAVDTSSLPKLGADWRGENPYRKNEAAIQVGTSAYNQNCARCHGIEAISGGVAPDLRKLDNECATTRDAVKKAACVKENDEYFLTTVRHGRTRNGAVYMPPFEGTFDQEAIWAIKAYQESRRDKPL